MTRFAPLICLVMASPAWAQSYDLREADVRLDSEALQERVTGQILMFYDDGASEYYTDGRYTYTYANQGGTAYGYWRLGEAGEICIDFVTGFERCDLYVTSGDRLMLLDTRGNRFPVRP